MKKLSLFIATAMFLFVSCEKEDGVDSKVNLPITFGVQSSLKSGAIQKSTAQNISFSEGHMLIGSLGFEAENIQDEDREEGINVSWIEIILTKEEEREEVETIE